VHSPILAASDTLVLPPVSAIIYRTQSASLSKTSCKNNPTSFMVRPTLFLCRDDLIFSLFRSAGLHACSAGGRNACSYGWSAVQRACSHGFTRNPLTQPHTLFISFCSCGLPCVCVVHATWQGKMLKLQRTKMSRLRSRSNLLRTVLHFLSYDVSAPLARVS
jgi:hypothetical protein